jgi:hypothetical protein
LRQPAVQPRIEYVDGKIKRTENKEGGFIQGCGGAVAKDEMGGAKA